MQIKASPHRPEHARPVQQWPPRSRLLTLPSLSVTSTNSDNSRAILIIDADLAAL